MECWKFIQYLRLHSLEVEPEIGVPMTLTFPLRSDSKGKGGHQDRAGEGAEQGSHVSRSSAGICRIAPGLRPDAHLAF